VGEHRDIKFGIQVDYR